MSQCEKLILGQLVGAHGVRGWLKVLSYTDPRENIFCYKPWFLKLEGRWCTTEVEASRVTGSKLTAKLEGVDSRDDALVLVDTEIAVSPDQLPELPPGEYYWHDLLGLAVINKQQETLGRIVHMLATGANDVMVVDGECERLIPYTDQAVVDIDLEKGVMTVDWQSDF